MDPQAALDRAESLLNSYDQDDLDEADECLEAYRSWRAGGGFQPADGDARFDRLLKELATR